MSSLTGMSEKCGNRYCVAVRYETSEWCAFHAGRPFRFDPSVHSALWLKPGSTGCDHNGVFAGNGDFEEEWCGSCRKYVPWRLL